MSAPPAQSWRQRLVVLSSDGFAVHVLPEQGTLTLGSAKDCDIRIEHASVAAHHARLVLETPAQLEDLGTPKGLMVRDRRLAPREIVDLIPGEPAQLGGVTIMLELRSGQAQRRILTDDYFELRVEEECFRADRNKSNFAVLGVRFDGAAGQAAELLLAQQLRLTDVIATHVPGSYEVLLPETAPASISTIVTRLAERIVESGLRAHIGVATFPNDARSADALLEKARRAPERSLPPPTALEVPALAQPGADSLLQVVYRMATLVAPTDMNVLIVGETGVGKERVAALVHAKSARAKKPLIGLNCAALSESLLESELFGHERGAFTGAQTAKPGLLEVASGGTVLLDEIGEMQPAIQGKLLRVIEERKMRRVGGLREIPIDVRFIAATNRDLESDSARGLFRSDLYFRLNGVTLSVPSLRERPQEIEPLAFQLIRETSQRLHRPEPPQLSDEVLRLFRSYGWPGNIRELRNVVERAVVLCGDGPITVAHIPESKMRASLAPRRPLSAPAQAPISRPPGVSSAQVPTPAPPVARTRSNPPEPARNAPRRGPGRLLSDELHAHIQHEERARIVDALARCAGNQTEAARILGISRRTLVKRLAAHDLPRPRKRGTDPA